MKSVKNAGIVAFCLLMMTILTGCEVLAKNTAEPVYVPNFEWAPPEQSAVGSAGVTFIIVNPGYGEVTNDSTWQYSPLYQDQLFVDFAKNLAGDFNELLAARGYTVRGPFAQFDEIPFPDKKGSDLTLYPVITLNLRNTISKNDKNIIAGYDVAGTSNVSYTISFAVRESLSKELMWTKKLEYPAKNYSWDYTQVSGSRYTTLLTEIQTNQIPRTALNDLARTLETTYREILTKAWAYLDPEEMRSLKKQARVLRKEKLGED